MSTELVKANPVDGFHYPYFLHVPDSSHWDEPRPILVEPNNTGEATDDYEKHRDIAERRLGGGLGRRIADALSVPFLMSVFPRPQSDPVDWTHYIHQLDVETMRINDGPLERVDLQLLDMIDDSRRRLSRAGCPVMDKFCMNGFSGSAKFANQFAAIHPTSLLSVSAGGLNGMTILPLEESGGHTLNYHIGIADLEELTGEPFELTAFREVNQFLYMGEDDDNDTIPYPDAWTDDELRETALAVYGDDMHRDRFPFCQEVYHQLDASAVFREYHGVGHTPDPAERDIVEFHQRSFDGDPIDEIRSALGNNVGA